MKRGYIWLLFILSLILLLALPLTYAQQLKVTSEHPFLVDNKWIPAKQLQVGDILKTIDGKTARITEINDIVSDESFPVYNLESSFSDFVVEDGLIAHNSNKPGRFYCCQCPKGLCIQDGRCGGISPDMVIKLKIAADVAKTEFKAFNLPTEGSLNNLEALKNHFSFFKDPRNPKSCFSTFVLLDESSIGKWIAPIDQQIYLHSGMAKKFYSKEIVSLLTNDGGLKRQLHFGGGIAGPVGSKGQFGVIIGGTGVESAFLPSLETQTGTWISLLRDYEKATGGKAYLLTGSGRKSLSELLNLESGDYSKLACKFLESYKQGIIQDGAGILQADIVLPDNKLIPFNLLFKEMSFSSNPDMEFKILKISLSE